MDERDTILHAIKNKKSLKSVICEEDAIDRLVKNKKKRESFREKHCFQWKNIDFLRYLDCMLKDFGTTRNKGNVCRDSNCLNQIYDLMVKTIGSRMDNEVLRDYIDWWCSIWAPRLTGSGVWLENLRQPHLIQRFLSRFADEVIAGDIETCDVSKNSEIYDLGGLSMLLMQRGIVVSCIWIKGISDTPEQDIKKELVKFSCGALIKVVELTIKRSPYSGEYVDFMFIARPFLQNHGVIMFDGMRSKSYFLGGK